MTTLALHCQLSASPEAVWAVVGDFGRLDTWHPWVPDCTLSEDGKTRTIGSGAMTAIETLESEGTLTHTYRVDRSPMPISDYRCTWTATGRDGRTHLAIQATYQPANVPEEQATAMLRGFFDAAFATLKSRFAR